MRFGTVGPLLRLVERLPRVRIALVKRFRSGTASQDGTGGSYTETMI